VFMLGCDRSGTTLLRTLLNRHPQVLITYEAPAPIVLRDAFATGGGEAAIAALRTFPQHSEVDWEQVTLWLSEVEAPALADVIALVYRTHLEKTGKSIWGDKTPAYTGFVDDLSEMFPNSVFIHVVRDPRAVAYSWMPTDWGPNTPFHAGREWDKRVSEATRALSKLPSSRAFTVRYEDLLSQPETVLCEACQVIGVQFTAELLDYGRDETATLPGEYFQLLHARSQRAIDPTRIERWREMPASSMTHIEASTWDLMQEFRYQPLNPRKPTVSKTEIMVCKVQNRVRQAWNNFRRRAAKPAFPLPSLR
jgi:Sulfotransferase family